MRCILSTCHFKSFIALAMTSGLWLGVLGHCQAQPQFYNLDFEMASDLPAGPPGTPGYIPTADALPGWTTYIDSKQTPGVAFDSVTAGTASISLLDRNAYTFGYLVIQGKFSVVLQSGDANGNIGDFREVPVSIGQTGQIPTTAQSVRFSTTVPPAAMFVTFNGQNLPIFRLDATDLACDISAYDGQVGELTFGAEPPQGFVVFDNISFSVQPAPEPGTIALIMCGAALVGVNRRRLFLLTRLACEFTFHFI